MIRLANNDDIDRINELGKNYNKDFKKLYDVASYINDPVYLVLVNEDNNKINGFIICTLMYETLEIILIYVDKMFRNKGIGFNLLQEIEKYDIIKILLEVSEKNISAYNLYLKCGYKVENIRKDYYKDSDAIIMVKVLK